MSETRDAIISRARVRVAVALVLVTASAAPALPAPAAAAQRHAPQVTAKCLPDVAVLGGYCGDGGPVGEARLADPHDVTALGDGFLIADGQNSAIRRVSAGVISTAAGLGIIGSTTPRRGRPASIADFALADPRGVAAIAGRGYAIADAGLRAVLMVSDRGLVRTLLDRRNLVLPSDVVARDPDTLVVADAAAGRVIEVDLDGTTRTVASDLANPVQVAPDPVSGGIYVGQQRAGGDGNVILIGPDGARSVVAGAGAPGVAGRLRFARVGGIVAVGRVLVVADRSVVRAVFPDGSVRVLAGASVPGGEAVNGVRPIDAEGLAMAADGSLLIADSGRDQIATVPDVPASLAQPPPPVRDEPEVEPAGRRSYATTAASPPFALSGPRGGPPRCALGSLSPAFKAVYARRGQVGVRFTGRGALQVMLVQGGKERQIFRRTFGRVQAGRALVIVRGRQLRGTFRVRVRSRGGCQESTFTV